MNATIHLSFRYSESDYARGMRSHYASRLRPRLDVIMTVLLAVAGVYFLRSPSSHWFGVFLVGASAAFALILVFAFLIIPPLAFRREPTFRDDYSLTFSPEGIHFHTVRIDSQLQWNLYSRALVDAYSYVLYSGSGSFTVIPKRVFQSAEQQSAFDQLLAQHIPTIVTK